MREKFQKLMKYKQLTSSRLAELLGVQASGISHILNIEGRKPSFELTQKILMRFPDINPDWLLLDSDDMLRPGYGADPELTTGNRPSHTGNGNGSLFESTENSQQSQQSFSIVADPDSTNTPAANGQVSSRVNNGANSQSATPSAVQNSPNAGSLSGIHFSGNRQVKRVIVLFEDHTFESYEMSRQ